MAAVGVVVVLLFLGAAALWIWAIVDAASRPDWVFEQAGSNKALWIILVVVLGIIGALIYLAAIRPGLVRAQTAGPGVYVPPFAPPYAAPPMAARPAVATPSAPDATGAPGTSAKFCENCGRPRTAATKFCAGCGAALR